MRRCPKCRIEFSSSPFTCECGAVFKDNKWTNLYDKNTVANMDKFFFESTYLHYLKGIPNLLQQEAGENLKPFKGYKRIKTSKNNTVLIFRAVDNTSKEISYVAWNTANDMVYRCRVGPGGTRAYIGDEEINDLEEWYYYLRNEL